MDAWTVGVFLGGAALGAAGVAAWMGGRLAAARAGLEAAARAETALREERDRAAAEIEQSRGRLDALGAELASTRTALAKDREAADERIALLTRAREELTNAFKALSAEALRVNNEEFLRLARGDLAQREAAIGQLVQPVRERLDRFDEKVGALEKARVDAFAQLREHLRGLQESQGQLRSEAQRLVQALGTPRLRGRWGELHLRRVVELAGMLDHCDFHEQVHTAADEGPRRPDLVVHMPSGRNVVVDAKAPLDAYLRAMDAPDEAARRVALAEHARALREHIRELGRRAYWNQFQPAPEFVVLFVPGEVFYAAALQEDPALIETGVEQGVLLAAPTTLIALLKAVAYGWRQERIEEHARQISEIGRELYDRLCTFRDHIHKVGRGLGSAVEGYNQAVGSFESRVLVSARRFQELKAAESGKALEAAPSVDTAVRGLSERAGDSGTEAAPDAASGSAAESASDGPAS